MAARVAGDRAEAQGACGGPRHHPRPARSQLGAQQPDHYVRDRWAAHRGPAQGLSRRSHLPIYRRRRGLDRFTRAGRPPLDTGLYRSGRSGRGARADHSDAAPSLTPSIAADGVGFELTVLLRAAQSEARLQSPLADRISFGGDTKRYLNPMTKPIP